MLLDISLDGDFFESDFISKSNKNKWNNIKLKASAQQKEITDKIERQPTGMGENI